jgi:hypothetical protein
MNYPRSCPPNGRHKIKNSKMFKKKGRRTQTLKAKWILNERIRKKISELESPTKIVSIQNKAQRAQ